MLSPSFLGRVPGSRWLPEHVSTGLPPAPADLASLRVAVCHEHPGTGKGPATPWAGRAAARMDAERERAVVCGRWTGESRRDRPRASWWQGRPESDRRGAAPASRVPPVKGGRAGAAAAQSRGQRGPGPRLLKSGQLGPGTLTSAASSHV